MKAYEKAMSIIEAEHKIVDVVYNYIDRLNDPCESDPLEKIAQEFVDNVNKEISNHLAAISMVR